jgi:hypothetical protein
MTPSFYIILSKNPGPDELTNGLTSMIPGGLRVDERSDIAYLPDE